MYSKLYRGNDTLIFKRALGPFNNFSLSNNAGNTKTNLIGYYGSHDAHKHKCILLNTNCFLRNLAIIKVASFNLGSYYSTNYNLNRQDLIKITSKFYDHIADMSVIDNKIILGDKTQNLNVKKFEGIAKNNNYIKVNNRSWGLCWNCQSLNKSDFKRAKLKREFILIHINKFYPLFIWLVDVNYEKFLKIKGYKSYYDGRNQGLIDNNLLSVVEKTDIGYILNKEIAFVYVRPNKDKNIIDFINIHPEITFIGDGNLKSNKSICFSNVIGEKSDQVIAININNKIADNSIEIEAPSDHNLIAFRLNGEVTQRIGSMIIDKINATNYTGKLLKGWIVDKNYRLLDIKVKNLCNMQSMNNEDLFNDRVELAWDNRNTSGLYKGFKNSYYHNKKEPFLGQNIDQNFIPEAVKFFKANQASVCKEKMDLVIRDLNGFLLDLSNAENFKDDGRCAYANLCINAEEFHGLSIYGLESGGDFVIKDKDWSFPNTTKSETLDINGIKIKDCLDNIKKISDRSAKCFNFKGKEAWDNNFANVYNSGKEDEKVNGNLNEFRKIEYERFEEEYLENYIENNTIPEQEADPSNSLTIEKDYDIDWITEEFSDFPNTLKFKLNTWRAKAYWIIRGVCDGLINNVSNDSYCFFLKKKDIPQSFMDLRFIVISPCTLRLIEMVIYPIVSNEVSIWFKYNAPYQKGFVAGGSTFIALQGILQNPMNIEKGGLLSGDLSRAFDSIEFNNLEKAIENGGPETWAKKAFSGWGKVMMNSGIYINGLRFERGRGAPMGFSLSPIAWDLYLEWCIKDTKIRNLKEGMIYADDVNAYLPCANLEIILQDGLNTGKSNNLTVNLKKSVFVTNNTEKEILIRNEEIKQIPWVKSAKILGRTLIISKTSLKGCDSDFTETLKFGNKKLGFHSLKVILLILGGGIIAKPRFCLKMLTSENLKIRTAFFSNIRTFLAQYITHLAYHQVLLYMGPIIWCLLSNDQIFEFAGFLIEERKTKNTWSKDKEMWRLNGAIGIPQIDDAGSKIGFTEEYSIMKDKTRGYGNNQYDIVYKDYENGRGIDTNNAIFKKFHGAGIERMIHLSMKEKKGTKKGRKPGTKLKHSSSLTDQKIDDILKNFQKREIHQIPRHGLELKDLCLSNELLRCKEKLGNLDFWNDFNYIKGNPFKIFSKEEALKRVYNGDLSLNSIRNAIGKINRGQSLGNEDIKDLHKDVQTYLVEAEAENLKITCLNIALGYEAVLLKIKSIIPPGTVKIDGGFLFRKKDYDNIAFTSIVKGPKSFPKFIFDRGKASISAYVINFCSDRLRNDLIIEAVDPTDEDNFNAMGLENWNIGYFKEVCPNDKTFLNRLKKLYRYDYFNYLGMFCPDFDKNKGKEPKGDWKNPGKPLFRVWDKVENEKVQSNLEEKKKKKKKNALKENIQMRKL